MPREPLVVDRRTPDPTMLEQSSPDAEHIEVRELLRQTVTDTKQAFTALWPVLSEELDGAYTNLGVQPVYIESEELASMLAARQRGQSVPEYEHATPIYPDETYNTNGIVYPPASGGYAPPEGPVSPDSEDVTGSITHRPFQIDGSEDV